MASPTAKSSAAFTKSYHLIWSPGFFSNLVFWIFVQATVLQAILNTEDYFFFFADLYEEYVKQNLLFFSHYLGNNFGVWSLITLLSSSCCAFQLILNCFSFGCAGFNTYLGPVRPFFLGIAVVGQVWMWSVSQNQELVLNGRYGDYVFRGVLGTATVVFMSLLPEMVYFWTVWRLGGSHGESSENGDNTSDAKNFDPKEVSTRALRIEGMGCVACVKTCLESAATAVVPFIAADGDSKTSSSSKKLIRHSTIKLEEGIMLVAFERKILEKKSEKEKEKILDAIGKEVSKNGFPAEAVPAAENDKLVKEMLSKSSCGDSPKRCTKASAPATPNPVASLYKSVIAGLLSSSCCLLQLLLNVLSMLNVVHVGCAGFNKYLGPARVYLRSFTTIWLSYGWLAELTGKSKMNGSGRMFRATVLTVGLMFLPELLMGVRKSSVIIKNPSTAWFTDMLMDNGVISEDAFALSNGVDAKKNTVRFVYTVDNMGCEACIDMVSRVISEQPNIVDHTLDFETGRAEIFVAADEKAGRAASSARSKTATDDHDMVEDDTDVASSGLTAAFDESKLSAGLEEHGYELKPEGWVTKKMLHDEKTKNKKDGPLNPMKQ